MGHNLMNGAMAFAGEVPWHRLGQKVPQGVRASQMIKLAGLDWKVEMVPAPGARRLSHETGRSSYDRYLLVRDKINGEDERPILGLVSRSYEVLQNDEAFASFEPLLEAGQGHFETAGALGNGERVWVQVRLKHSIEVARDDVVEPYLLLANAHDGRGSLSIRFTPIRVVCQNTLNLATREGATAIRILHTRNIRKKLEDEQAALLRLIQETFGRAAAHFQRLAGTQATPDLQFRYLNALFPSSERQKQARETPRRWKMVYSVLHDEAVTPPETSHTMWALYNAVTRCEDYRRSREATPDARLQRVWFGHGADLKVRALNTALRIAEAA